MTVNWGKFFVDSLICAVLGILIPELFGADHPAFAFGVIVVVAILLSLPEEDHPWPPRSKEL